MVGILKDDAYCTSDFKLWWTRVHDVCLKKFALDSDAFELINFSLSNNTEVLVYVEKINDGGIVVSKDDVVALDDEDEGVGNEVVRVEVVVSKSDSSDTEFNEGGSESGSENDNEGVVFEDSEEERATGVNDGFDSKDEHLVNLISKKKNANKLIVLELVVVVIGMLKKEMVN